MPIPAALQKLNQALTLLQELHLGGQGERRQGNPLGDQHEITCQDQPIVQSVIEWTSFTRISDLLPTARVESGSADDQNTRKVPHPPPNEGFKAWPDVPLFILHSAFLI